MRRLGVVLVLGALVLAVGPASAWGHGLTRAQAREVSQYDSGLVLARPGAGPALRRAGGVKLTNRLPIWRVPSRSALQVLPSLLRSNLVSEVAADQPLSTLAMPSEGGDWWLPAVGANPAAAPGPGKPLTIIDTGVDLAHEEFAGRPSTTALNAQSTAASNEEHGTAVASMAAAPLNTLGIVGAYPQANLFVWDASPSGAGITAGDVVLGLDAAIRQGAGVVNLSLGSQVRNPLLDKMIAVAQGAGILVVAAAGNSRELGSPLEYPASDPHVLTVGATDVNNQPAFFTSGSPHVDLAAPGDLVWAAVPTTATDKYAQVQGTSFASPIVAAAADLVWTARPTLDWTQLAEIMRASAQDLFTPGFDPFTGFGRLNIPAALTVAPVAPDPQEPNEDVTFVKPGGFLHHAAKPLTAVRRKSGNITARLDFGDDPRDVYRIWVPGKRSASVALQPSGGDVDLALWGPKTGSVLESGRTLRRDTRGISERNGTKRERLTVKNTARKGAYYYVEA
ncbi:MAG TPA: S8 family serine peptidase, partial [Gaiellaceae bacterium]